MGEGIVQGVDAGPAVAFGPVDDFGCGVGARRQNATGTRIFCRSEYACRLIGRVVHRGHAESQMSERRPVLHGYYQIFGIGSVRMRVNETRYDRLTAEIENCGARGNTDIVTHGLQSIALHHNRATFNHAGVSHGHDSCVRECDRAGWGV